MNRGLFSSPSGAVISADGRYRYLLRRTGFAPSGRIACFIMLNPSTADHERDDATIRKCIGFARQWMCGELLVVNLFALRSRHPSNLWADGVEDPVGPENSDYINLAVERADAGPDRGVVCCAWGVNGSYMSQDLTVLGWVDWCAPRCLRLTKAGHPEHPLFVPYAAAIEPRRFNGRRP